MVLGMIGLGYVASHSKSEISAATGAQQVVTVRADPKGTELEALQAEAALQEVQSLRSGLRSDEPAGEGNEGSPAKSSEDDIEQQEEESLQAVGNGTSGSPRCPILLSATYL